MHQTNNNNDLALIRAVQIGNKHAFNLLTLKYQYRILKLISRYIRDPQESLDVIQEVFIKAYTAIGSFRLESSFYTWLYKIAINTAKSYLMEQSRHLPNFSFDILENEQLVNVDRSSIKNHNSPYDLIICQELEAIFLSIVDKLPEELKMTIKLREVDELTYDEIAIIMECPVGTVRSRIFRAREAIKKEINNKRQLIN